MVDEIADYYAALAAGEYPVKARVSPGYLRPLLPAAAPEAGESLDAILADVHAKIMPGITHWQAPGFFAFFPANSSPPALLGDMLSDAINCIGFSWVASPACTELETIVLDWLVPLIGLPATFASAGTGGGVIQSSASDATLVALLAARARAAAAAAASGTTPPRYVVYASEHAHSSVRKAASVMGLGDDAFRAIPAPGPTYAMDVAALETAMAADAASGAQPIAVVATLGTTSSGAFDPLRGVTAAASRHGAWVHVDAAWAGAAGMCEEHRAWLDGVEGAHSYAFNPHKWLRVNFDCSAMFVRERRWLAAALSLTPAYLRSPEYDSGLVTDYRDWQVPLGRRFRALKLWFTLRMYGAAALRAHIRAHVALAGAFAAWVRNDPAFEVVAPPSLALVCFRLRASNAANDALLAAVNASGTTFLVSTVLDGRTVLRLAVGGSLTREEHVAAAWEAIQVAARTVLATYPST